MRQLLAVSLVLFIATADGAAGEGATAAVRISYRRATIKVGDKTVKLRQKKAPGSRLQVRSQGGWVRADKNRVAVDVIGNIHAVAGDPSVTGIRYEVTTRPRQGFVLRTVGFKDQNVLVHLQQVSRAITAGVDLDLKNIGAAASRIDDVLSLQGAAKTSMTFRSGQQLIEIGSSDGTPYTLQPLAPGRTISDFTLDEPAQIRIHNDTSPTP